MKKTALFSNISGLCLFFGAANCAFAQDGVIKLNSIDGGTKFIVQDNAAASVFSADSDGNTITGGTATVAGSAFSAGGAAFAVKGGRVGIGTAEPALLLEVNGAAQFGAGAAKSTFTATGELLLAGALTLPADPTAALHAATKQYVDAAAAAPAACPAGMVEIPGAYPYCVDIYEAYLLSGTVTNCTCTEGSRAEVDACGSTAVAGSGYNQEPLVSINWCAAKKACENAGKHLLTNMEWFNAANYKGGKWNLTAEEAAEAMACNTDGSGVNFTGASAGCVTQEGVYDMIGNAWEWVDFVVTADPTNALASGYITGYDFATGMPAVVGTSANAYGNDYYWAYNGAGAARALFRGGTWTSTNFAGVFTFLVNNAPSYTDSSAGFRCGRRK
jgi:hypothetical protein